MALTLSLASFSFSPKIHTSFPSFPLSKTLTSPTNLTITPISLPNSKRRQILAVTSDPTVIETAQDIVSSDDDVSSVVSALLFAAFIGLSILTLGVIYLAVTDFLQKREKDKFEKEEAAASGGKKKKKKIVRAGPKGFGQKIVDDNEDDD